MTEDWQDVEFRQDARKALGIAVFFSLLALTIGGMALALGGGVGSLIVAAGVAAFLGGFSFRFWKSYALGDRPVVTVGPKGIRDIRLSEEWLAWTDIKRLGWGYDWTGGTARVPISRAPDNDMAKHRRWQHLWIEISDAAAKKAGIAAAGSPSTVVIYGSVFAVPFEELRVAICDAARKGNPSLAN